MHFLSSLYCPQSCFCLCCVDLIPVSDDICIPDHNHFTMAFTMKTISPSHICIVWVQCVVCLSIVVFLSHKKQVSYVNQRKNRTANSNSMSIYFNCCPRVPAWSQLYNAIKQSAPGAPGKIYMYDRKTSGAFQTPWNLY